MFGLLILIVIIAKIEDTRMKILVGFKFYDNNNM